MPGANAIFNSQNQAAMEAEHAEGQKNQSGLGQLPEGQNLMDNEDDKKWVENLDYQITGPLDAENLERYPRIEHWLLSQKVINLVFTICVTKY